MDETAPLTGVVGEVGCGYTGRQPVVPGAVVTLQFRLAQQLVHAQGLLTPELRDRAVRKHLVPRLKCRHNLIFLHTI